MLLWSVLLFENLIVTSLGLRCYALALHFALNTSECCVGDQTCSIVALAFLFALGVHRNLQNIEYCWQKFGRSAVFHKSDLSNLGSL